jgi:cytochrome P450
MFTDPDFFPFNPPANSLLNSLFKKAPESWPTESYTQNFTEIPGIWPLLKRTILVSDPDLIEDVLVSRSNEFLRSSHEIKARSNIINRESLIILEGEDWRWQKRSASPAFRHINIMRLVPAFARCAKETIANWNVNSDGVILEATQAMMGISFPIIIRAVLGSGSNEINQSKFIECLKPELAAISWRFLFSRLGMPTSLPFPGASDASSGVEWLSNTVSSILEHKRKNLQETDDIISLLLEAKDPETGRCMSDSELISNLYMFLVAGHGTAATALAWTLWILAKDQESQRKVREEIENIIGEREINAEDIDKLIFTKMVLQESMRLFPPAIPFSRSPIIDTTLGGLDLKKGEVIIVSPWCTHRHQKIWQSPSTFDPMRFLPENIKSRHKHAYFPFGSGPRVCIGFTFAMAEIIVVIATLVKYFNFASVPGHKISLSQSITLNSTTGLPLIIKKLSKRSSL